jgi:hypothetical protein
LELISKKLWEELFCLFPYISYLFKVLEPNLVELDLSELALTSFNIIQLNLTEFTAVNNLVTMVTMKRKQPNPTV